MRAAYSPRLLSGIDMGREMKRTAAIQFAGDAAPELLHLGRPKSERLLLNAERRLAAGDVETAQKMAQQALDEESGRSRRGHYLFWRRLRSATAIWKGARTYFERALQMAHEPKVIAWSHIYLGRIFDLKEERDVAVDHYREAVNVAGGDTSGSKDGGGARNRTALRAPGNGAAAAVACSRFREIL